MKRLFIKEFLKNRKQIGSIAPSSRLLAKRMLQPIDFLKAKVFIEYGPGTGVFTRKIIQKMSPESKLFIFELDTQFYNQLNKEFGKIPNVYLIKDSALKAQEYIQAQQISEVDAVISSLPLMNFKLRVSKSIVDNSKKILAPDGHFIQYQYSLNAKKMLERTFEKVSIQYVVGNIPPAFVYDCKKR